MRRRWGIIAPILVDPRHTILAAEGGANLDVSLYEIVDAEHSHAAAEKAVTLMAGRGQITS